MRYSILMLALLLASAAAVNAQDAGGSASADRPSAGAGTELSELVAEARAVSPEIQAARRRVDAAAARIPQAGARPDPMISAGLMYLPLPDFGVRDEGMSMALLELEQRFPARDVRAEREAVARRAHEAAAYEADEIELRLVTRLKEAYYEAYFVERSLDVVERNRVLLVDLARVAATQYAVGRAPQQDALRAQTEVTRLDGQRSSLESRHAAALAEINAILQRPALQPVRPVYPQAVQALARASSGPALFTAAAVDAGLGAGFPSLAELQERALSSRPMLRAHVQRIAGRRHAVRLAERELWPDVGVALGYGARWGRPNTVSARVTLSLPVFAGRKQRMAIVEAVEELAAHELEHHKMVSDIRSEVALHYADLVRKSEQILLLRDGVVPQARATVESAAAAYQAGRVEFHGLLDAQATLYRHEIELARQFADFGRALAALERAAGFELEVE